MKKIVITNEHKQIVKEYAPGLDIGGFSNLSKADLNKSSRLEYQYTGLYGELAWYIYRYGEVGVDKFIATQTVKNSTIKPGQGDGGYDDRIQFDISRLIDVKASHVIEESKIQYLNLVIPPRELHNDSLYIAAFTIGKDRINVDEVVLAGYVLSENVKDKWKYDNYKFAVAVKNLSNLDELNEKLQ